MTKPTGKDQNILSPTSSPTIAGIIPSRNRYTDLHSETVHSHATNPNDYFTPTTLAPKNKDKKPLLPLPQQ